MFCAGATARPGRSREIGPQLADAAAEALAQARAQGGAVDVTDLGRDGLEVEVAALDQGLGALDAQVLEIGLRPAE